MSSGFVSASTKPASETNQDGWLAAQKAIDASQRSRQQEGKQEGGKSLFEVLEQNKSAKQEAFEESLRLKNQFRTLDEDEVDFLDNVLESTREKEQQVKRETAEELEAFRKKREAAEKALVDADVLAGNLKADPKPSSGEESWVASNRKRRRMNGKDDSAALKIRRKSASTTGISRRKSQEGDTSIKSSPDNKTTAGTACEGNGGVANGAITHPKHLCPSGVPASRTSTHTSVMALVAYSSDEE